MKAFTLLETLISASLMLLLAGLLAYLGAAMQRPSHKAHQLMQLDQTALVLERRLQQDVSRVAKVDLRLQPSLGISMQPLLGVDQTSQQIWSEVWVMYRWSDQKLLRWESRDPDLNRPVATQLLAQGLARFEWSSLPQGCVRVDYILQNEYQLQRSLCLWMRNARL
ncbi:MAG: hypothetical protein KF760_08240 [Candidatus Eremiobacteraeota bacterium]|nr:hypothetical protein [Candidatus Eremiobacteraeota bacterium]MCW5871503.1 hypothetical protein [Candidatus Eremiobacteraeota bacterium]